VLQQQFISISPTGILSGLPPAVAHALLSDTRLQQAARREGSRMGLLSWIIVGLIAGYVGSRIVNKTGEGLVRDILLGILGAMVGGSIFTRLGYAGVTGVNFPSILIAIVGAVIVLVLYHAVAGQRAG
jgi:uncharacterized membrane protein YeaQ/YmgE (transglycosylase-associated protein family)